MKNLLLFTVFITLTLPSNAQTVTDIDGNVYDAVTIGTQTWMAANLRTTHYANGTAIPLVTGNNNWDALTNTSKAYCWYDDDSATNANTYGALYTWSAAMNGAASSSSSPSGIQGVCPTGWHLPSDDEWTTLTDYLGGTDVAGGKLKETDTTHWQSPNTGATNESGFTGLPGGARGYGGAFFLVGYEGHWWSSTEYSTNYAWIRRLGYDYSSVSSYDSDEPSGYSVRCVMDNNTSITNSINSEEVIFYPNPATEKLYLKNSNYANNIIMIFDLHGKQVLSEQIDSDPIDISNLSKGIYVVKLVDSENVRIAKFIKE